MLIYVTVYVSIIALRNNDLKISMIAPEVCGRLLVWGELLEPGLRLALDSSKTWPCTPE